MTTDPFTAAARALGADPAEVRESMRNATEHAERNGIPDEEFALWIWHAGAVWARGMEAARAAQEPTDAEVEAAAEGMWDRYGNRGMWKHAPDHLRRAFRSDARAALSAARAARRDEEKRDG